jgi:hypothetical protein
MEPVAGAPPHDPVDRLIVELRAYIGAPKAKGGQKKDHRWTSGISVTFDTETTTDPSQRLGFGAYQIRDRGELIERGFFHAADLSAADLTTLREAFSGMEPTDAGERLCLRSRAEFVDEVFFGWGHDVGGLVVGFNLPFDISRIPIEPTADVTPWTYARGSMKGGFSFDFGGRHPNLRVKHLSQRAAFINFAAKHSNESNPDPGLFVDVKTLAAALTGQSHTLESLTGLLKTTPKSPLDSYDGPLTPEKVAYCMNDVQATWECFAKLADRYEAFGLERTGLHELYSEASLGKAYLQAMNITPWRRAQPDFPPELLGQIMSTYYGGRAEVHIRREPTPVIHCDFLSMYPTVCTLMGLWRYVIAEGITWIDATDEIRDLVGSCERDDLRCPELWAKLHCIVQVKPDDDVFPVRAEYFSEIPAIDGGRQPATIGLNRLTSREPIWFTLADVLASRLLTGKSPEILQAVRFDPKGPQRDLRSVMLEGVELQPAQHDFYRMLIDQRRRVQAAENAAGEADKPALNASQQGLKILANSTSYGIFVEVNVQQLEKAKTVTCYDFRGVGRKMTAKKVEEPGRYYHPLLATLITGAARLMLALAERNAIDQGLDWAFCDTDSLAIANTADLPKAEFIDRVKAVLAWYETLNPYEAKGSILQLEKVNFPAGQHNDPTTLRPVNCLAISAKRYVLFDRGESGEPVIRKATAHGLGHLLSPYQDPDKERASKRLQRIGVHLWQEDLWRAIIEAHDRGRPDQPDLSPLARLDLPAASRYAATNQTLFAWFKAYNASRTPLEQVRPFNFLLAYQAKSRMEMASVDLHALVEAAWRRREPNPASRYSKDLVVDPPEVFDRRNGDDVPWGWLKTYQRALARHHLHSELKFRGGEDAERGTLRRRHVHVWAAIPIGKEADNLEERQAIGDDGDDVLEWEMARADRARVMVEIETTLKSHGISDARLTRTARVSHHTLSDLRAGKRVTQQSLRRMAHAIEELRHEAEAVAGVNEDWLAYARQLRDEVGGRNKLAVVLGLNPSYVGRFLNGDKPVTAALIGRLKRVRSVESLRQPGHRPRSAPMRH